MRAGHVLWPAVPRRCCRGTLATTTTTTRCCGGVQPASFFSSSSSSKQQQQQWRSRQSRDPFARAARVQGLRSRAAFKLLHIHDRHRLFRPGQTVVDLGYAPGSWSQVSIFPHERE